MILLCSCRNSYQDREYGVGYRVHNPCLTQTKQAGARCTVCGDIKSTSVTDAHIALRRGLK